MEVEVVVVEVVVVRDRLNNHNETRYYLQIFVNFVCL